MFIDVGALVFCAVDVPLESLVFVYKQDDVTAMPEPEAHLFFVK